VPRALKRFPVHRQKRGVADGAHRGRARDVANDRPFPEAIAVAEIVRTQATNYARMVEHVSPYNRVLDMPWAMGAWSVHTAAGPAKLSGEIARQAGENGYTNARLAYGVYEEVFGSDRWHALAAAGARPQRPLWASTGVKDPSYDDTRYVVDLVAPGTVNTMPQATMDAVADHGVLRGDTVSV